MSEHDPVVYLQDMYEFGAEALEMSRGRSREELDRSREFGLAMQCIVGRIGRMAAAVPADIRRQHPAIPWQMLADTANRLTRDYEHVDYNAVWQIITASVPALLPQLDRAVAQIAEDADS